MKWSFFSKKKKAMRHSLNEIFFYDYSLNEMEEQNTTIFISEHYLPYLGAAVVLSSVGCLLRSFGDMVENDEQLRGKREKNIKWY